MDPFDLASNIEDTILRTRQIMEESKALTMKNQQRKNMLQEKFSFNDLKPENSSINSSKSTSQIIRRISEIEIVTTQETPRKSIDELQKIEELQIEIFELNKKIRSQALTIDKLEERLSEVNIEKMQLLKDLNSVKAHHELEVSQIKQKIKITEKSVPENLGNIEERIEFLEEKYEEQVIANHRLIEEIKKLKKIESGSSNKKINDLEELLMSSIKKYKGLKNRLDKTENLIAFEKSSFFTPKSNGAKNFKFSSPKKKKKTVGKGKLSSYKSTTAKVN